MNQKQRDLLCTMVERQANKTRALLDKQFLLVDNLNRCVTDRYNKFRIDEDKLVAIPTGLRKLYETLKKRQLKLDTEKNKLGKDWDIWCESVGAYAEKDKVRKSAAQSKLDVALCSAIIDIQFADNAFKAKEVINSLPGVAQIMS